MRKLINGVRLTPREVEICQLMVQGLSQPQIAARLVMERRTVYWYTNAIRAKLGAANTCDLLRMLHTS